MALAVCNYTHARALREFKTLHNVSMYNRQEPEASCWRIAKENVSEHNRRKPAIHMRATKLITFPVLPDIIMFFFLGSNNKRYLYSIVLQRCNFAVYCQNRNTMLYHTNISRIFQMR